MGRIGNNCTSDMTIFQILKIQRPVNRRPPQLRMTPAQILVQERGTHIVKTFDTISSARLQQYVGHKKLKKDR